jgi:hypothetical protein
MILIYRQHLLRSSLPATASFAAGASTSEGCSTEGPDCQAATGRQALPPKANETLTGVTP